MEEGGREILPSHPVEHCESSPAAKKAIGFNEETKLPYRGVGGEFEF